MRLTTKFVAIASAGALALGMTACGAGDTESKSGKTRIGVSVYDMSSFITAGKEPAQPASPQPFTPSGLCEQGVPLTVSTVRCGMSSARGIA